ncbi:lamin tail domain-containing protein [Algoriphagus zhangzhouensis]|uniref:Lamin Tail Domain n=1 Tax=Algoriphagus zhangzhouensis TaxID=1073327 RepID=A0A1M7ZG09_9BACT|nr:lamin tail domain-containing protein [Algoriphagus zhangzhouensis]TDY44857.1 lamin tail-like protein [Algoriphagus zhangzhouensis]SHO63851.1 Lamin Tail Domain [Algoriphagus zhangzhouensis]
MRLVLLFVLAFLPVIRSSLALQNPFQESFENDFSIESIPNSFLPNWYGNEVRSTSSRIFQSSSLGIGESKCLAIQPISTFDGEVIVRLIPSDYLDPKVQFWAKSIKNGLGTRAAQVFISWAENLEGNFENRVQVGNENEFFNEDQEFKKFTFEVPENLQGKTEVYLKFEIEYGEGSGSCSRFLMDDFFFGDVVEDITPPRVSMVRGYDSNQIEIAFSEPIDPVFSQIQLNYKLDQNEPLEAKLEEDSLVYLTFEEELQIGESYELEVRQIPDMEGNFLMDTTLTFEFSDPTNIQWKELVINEIMPAPKAENDLPNVEYIELFHAGEYPLRLGGMTLANSRNEAVLPEYWLAPGDFLILTSENSGNEMEVYGNVLGPDSWPTLLNSGDQISIKNDQGELVDQIDYSTATWGGSEWSGGGYSLELENPFLQCDQSDSLLPSIDPSRGTPGKINSVFDETPDLEAPQLIQYEFGETGNLILTFSESLQEVGLNDSFQFSPFLGIDSVWLIRNQISFSFQEGFPENELVKLSISDLLDCSGNSIATTEVEIIRPSEAKIGEVMINEVLFNPKSGSPKFVELVNATDKYLGIKNWNLANWDDLGEVNQVRGLSESSLILPPKGYLAITTDASREKMDYPKSIDGDFHEIASLPSYPISGGTVVLMQGASIAETFTYSEDLHHPLLQDTKGVSLERVSLDSSADWIPNWHSASESEGFATPGRKNSQVIQNELVGNIIQISPEAFDPEGSNGQTFTTISYELDQAGWIGSFRIYDLAGRMVSSLSENDLLATRGLYTWTGTDQNGKLVRSGYYVLLVELFNLEGEKISIKKTIVVAQRL